MAPDPATPPRYDDLPDLLTPEELQHFLRVGRNTAYELIKSGAIHSLKFGKLIRIPKTELIKANGNGTK